MSLRGEFARFAIVGGVGFVVDGAVLQLLVGMRGWSPFAARALSFPAAVTVTFLLNRTWTFRDDHVAPALRAYGAYGVVQATGAFINLAVFSLCLLAAPSLEQRPLIALAIGAAVAMMFNFAASRFAVFRSRR